MSRTILTGSRDGQRAWTFNARASNPAKAPGRTRYEHQTPGQSETPPPPAYMALVRAFALRPIRNRREYDAAAAAIVDRLAVRPEGSLDPGEQDYLDTLTLLIQAYDDEHFQLKCVPSARSTCSSTSWPKAA